jgi:hypothetical protein
MMQRVRALSVGGRSQLLATSGRARRQLRA